MAKRRAKKKKKTSECQYIHLGQQGRWLIDPTVAGFRAGTHITEKEKKKKKMRERKRVVAGFPRRANTGSRKDLGRDLIVYYGIEWDR